MIDLRLKKSKKSNVTTAPLTATFCDPPPGQHNGRHQGGAEPGAHQAAPIAISHPGCSTEFSRPAPPLSLAPAPPSSRRMNDFFEKQIVARRCAYPTPRSAHPTFFKAYGQMKEGVLSPQLISCICARVDTT